MIVSELCQNHNGDLNLLKEMVHASSEAGASFAKIQTFFAKDCKWERDQERLKELELSWEDHAKFVRWCREYNITPMTSVYNIKYAQNLYELGFRYIKIGSAQCTDSNLAKDYFLSGFNVIISTGGTDIKNIKKFHPTYGVLHCISQYPSDPFKSNLLRMYDLKKYWPSSNIGFSDHSDPEMRCIPSPSELAIYLGAKIIERHFTLLPKWETKDGKVSVNQYELRSLCEWDKTPREEQIKKYPILGMLKYPQEDDEIRTIENYRSRWK